MASTPYGKHQSFHSGAVGLQQPRLGQSAPAATRHASAASAPASITRVTAAARPHEAFGRETAGAARAVALAETMAPEFRVAVGAGKSRGVSSPEQGRGARPSDNSIPHAVSGSRGGSATTRKSHDTPRCRYRDCVLEAVYSLTNGVKKKHDIQEELRFCSRHAEQARLIFAKSADDLASKRVDFVETHKTCAEQNCIIAPSFGTEGSNTLTHCFRHASAGMTYVGKTTCRHPGCYRSGVSPRSPNQMDGLFCVRHSLERRGDLPASERDGRHAEATLSSAESERRSLSARRAEHDTISPGKPCCIHPGCSLGATYDVGGRIVGRSKMAFCLRHSAFDGQSPSTGNGLTVSGMLTGPRGALGKTGLGLAGASVARPQHATLGWPRPNTNEAADIAGYKQQAERKCGASVTRSAAHNVRVAPPMVRDRRGKTATTVSGVLGLTKNAGDSPSARYGQAWAQGWGVAGDGASHRSGKRAGSDPNLPPVLARRSDWPRIVDLTASPSGTRRRSSANVTWKQQTEPRPGHDPSFATAETTCDRCPLREVPADASTTASPRTSGGQGRGKRCKMTASASAGEEASAAAVDEVASELSVEAPAAAELGARRHEEASSATGKAAAERRCRELPTRKGARERAQSPLVLTPTGWLEWDWTVALRAGDGGATASEA